MQQVLMHQLLLKRMVQLIDKLKNIPDNLSNLKNKVDKLDIGKLETTPLDLSDAVNMMQLSDVVKTEVVKKKVYNELFLKN